MSHWFTYKEIYTKDEPLLTVEGGWGRNYSFICPETKNSSSLVAGEKK